MRRLVLFGALLLPLRGQDAAKLEHARAVNLERAAKLPSFVADEKAVRFKSRHTDPPKWELFDTIESEIVVRGAEPTRENVRRDGKPWKKPDFSDFSFGVSFGNELQALFNEKCRTALNFEGPVAARGRQVLAYRFESQPNGCFGNASIRNGLFSVTKRRSPVWTGRFLIDDPGGNVVQFEKETSDFPKGFGADPIRQSISWDYVQIGENSYLLPVASEIFGGFTKGDLWHVVVEFKNHRHFEASTNITFK